MLRTFADEGSDYFMRIEEAQTFDQRPFRSMLIQKWIAFRPGRGFHITREGRAAWREFEETEIQRKNPSLPLTAYFDPAAYGLKNPYRKRARVHEIPVSFQHTA
jgi:hypothetical protein